MELYISIGTFLTNYDSQKESFKTTLYIPMYENEQNERKNKSMEATQISCSFAILSLVKCFIGNYLNS